MSQHDLISLAIDRMAQTATDKIMARLVTIVRQVVTQEVADELADQRIDLEDERKRIERMEQTKVQPRLPPRDLVSAAAKVAAAATALENAQFSPGERVARSKHDAAIIELRKAYRNYAGEQRRKGL